MNAIRHQLATHLGHGGPQPIHVVEHHPIRSMAIALLWIVIAALVAYLAWIAHVQTSGVPAPPWFLPIA